MKKRIIILGALVLLLVLGWTGLWFFVTGQIRQEIAAQAFADGETRPQLTCANLAISGYPFNIDIDCTDAVIVSGDLMVEIPGVRASAVVYRPTHFLASARGAAEIADAFTGQRSAIAWSSLEGSLRIENWRIARLSLVATELAWTDLLFGDLLIAQSHNVELHLLDIPERHDPERALSALALYARAGGIDMPGLTLSGTDIEIEAEITALPDDLRRFGDAPLLPRWQAAGGTLDIVAIRASDATSSLDASGSLALGPTGLLDGQIVISSLGVAERVGALLEDPWRTLVLGVPAADGRHANQINFNAGTVSSGLVPIGAIPPLF